MSRRSLAPLMVAVCLAALTLGLLRCGGPSTFAGTAVSRKF